MMTDSQHPAAIWFDTLLNAQVWIKYNASAATSGPNLIKDLTTSLTNRGDVIHSLKYLQLYDEENSDQMLSDCSSLEHYKFLPLVMKVETGTIIGFVSTEEGTEEGTETSLKAERIELKYTVPSWMILSKHMAERMLHNDLVYPPLYYYLNGSDKWSPVMALEDHPLHDGMRLLIFNPGVS
eukprot:GHVU01046494.1.p1 GENE.GHVU01046494.1~~GHVU01046494.1.p1  ORF type:complete len:181 (+),score=19.81 GHVU01046494.1:446-988(+)